MNHKKAVTSKIIHTKKSHTRKYSENLHKDRNSQFWPRITTKPIDARTKLFPYIKRCHEQEQGAFLRLETLVVDGQTYEYGETQGRPVPVK